MTREEAAAYLRPIMESATLPRYQEALRLAVEALEGRAEMPALRGSVTLDRGQWEGCTHCNDSCCCTCKYSITRQTLYPCRECNMGSMYDPQNYCPNCGRPLTEEAWSELERGG